VSAWSALEVGEIRQGFFEQRLDFPGSPSTGRLAHRALQFADHQLWVGGAGEIRTPDLRRAKAALSQLSYGPDLTATVVAGGPWWTRTTGLGLIRTAL
jgi:hypothetical protein